jgi:hypothetical protein
VQEEEDGTAVAAENPSDRVTKGVSDVRVQPSPKAFEAYTPGFLHVFNAFPAGYRGQQRLCFGLWQERALETRAVEFVDKIERLKIIIWPKRTPQYRPSLHTWLDRAYYDDELMPLPASLSMTPTGPDLFDEMQKPVYEAQCETNLAGVRALLASNHWSGDAA